MFAQGVPEDPTDVVERDLWMETGINFFQLSSLESALFGSGSDDDL